MSRDVALIQISSKHGVRRVIKITSQGVLAEIPVVLHRALTALSEGLHPPLDLLKVENLVLVQPVMDREFSCLAESSITPGVFALVGSLASVNIVVVF